MDEPVTRVRNPRRFRLECNLRTTPVQISSELHKTEFDAVRDFYIKYEKGLLVGSKGTIHIEEHITKFNNPPSSNPGWQIVRTVHLDGRQPPNSHYEGDGHIWVYHE